MQSAATVVRLTLLAAALAIDTSGLAAQQATGRRGAAQLHDAMRKLWADHVVWTRQYIVDAVAGSPAAEASSKRLLRNQEEIGNAIVPFYGSAAGAKLTDLLKQHILIAVDVVAAAKAGDNAKLTEANTRWQANAADIAGFLSSANPNWPRQALLTMLNEHLELTTQEATARLQQRWTDDVTAFDRVHVQAMHMADALSDGIVKQFPGKVASSGARP